MAAEIKSTKGDMVTVVNAKGTEVSSDIFGSSSSSTKKPLSGRQ